MAAVVVFVVILLYAAGYIFYSKYLSVKVFGLREDFVTPAHELNDGVDYVPTPRFILFGHHYASIAGLAPMLGPAVAVIWGWVPAMLWVVLGALFVGCVHDFGSLVLSVRAKGKSIGQVTEGIIGKRAKTLFHLIIFFLVSLAMGVFVFVIAFLFSPAKDAATAAIHFPQAVTPSFGLMLVAMVMGYLVVKGGKSWKQVTPIGFIIVLLLTLFTGNKEFIAGTTLADPNAFNVDTWSWLLLGYALAASILPVWVLLQPRDFLNSLLLYLGLGTLYISFFVTAPEFVAPAFKPDPVGSPPIFPFVFVVIACGAASGFHSLVASGTTAKQLNKETDARSIGYGGMIGESLLGLMAVLAVTGGLTENEWAGQYSSWQTTQGLGAKIGAFILGSSRFLESIGIDPALGQGFVSLVVVSYALTSLDSATRLLRYNVEEIAESIKIGNFRLPPVNRYVSSGIAVAAIAFFTFYKVGDNGKAAGLALWGLFGTTNQLLAGLALLAITLYLLWRGRQWWIAGIPAVFVLIATLGAMISNIQGFYKKGESVLLVVGCILFALAVWVLIEAGLAIRRFREAGTKTDKLEIELASD